MALQASKISGYTLLTWTSPSRQHQGMLISIRPRLWWCIYFVVLFYRKPNQGKLKLATTLCCKKQIWRAYFLFLRRARKFKLRYYLYETQNGKENCLLCAHKKDLFFSFFSFYSSTNGKISATKARVTTLTLLFSTSSFQVPIKYLVGAQFLGDSFRVLSISSFDFLFIIIVNVSIM